MIIGILSMQQVPNYGSFLQAYGLKTTLENLGHHVNFIDIIPGEQLNQFKQGKYSNVKKGLNRLLCRNPLKMVYYSLKFHKRYKTEFIKFLYKDNINVDRYDCVVIGSDEVFNIAQSTWFGFSKQLFGEGLNTSKVISYAACCGATTVEKLNELGLKKIVGEMLSKNFTAISVRDDNSVKVVNELTGKKTAKNIDPVLLYDFSKEIPAKTPHSDKRYMIIYTYPARMSNPEEIKVIKQFAKENGLEIIAISDYFDWVDTVVTPNPFEVLAYFRDAQYIVTDTFHGTVMSIIQNKPFATFVRNMNSNKLTGLLNQFSLQDREVKDPTKLGSILNQQIDYDSVNILINQEREKSMQYLKNNL